MANSISDAVTVIADATFTVEAVDDAIAEAIFTATFTVTFPAAFTTFTDFFTATFTDIVFWLSNVVLKKMNIYDAKFYS